MYLNRELYSVMVSAQTQDEVAKPGFANILDAPFGEHYFKISAFPAAESTTRTRGGSSVTLQSQNFKKRKIDWKEFPYLIWIYISHEVPLLAVSRYSLYRRSNFRY